MLLVRTAWKLASWHGDDVASAQTPIRFMLPPIRFRVGGARGGQDGRAAPCTIYGRSPPPVRFMPPCGRRQLLRTRSPRRRSRTKARHYRRTAPCPSERRCAAAASNRLAAPRRLHGLGLQDWRCHSKQKSFRLHIIYWVFRTLTHIARWAKQLDVIISVFPAQGKRNNVIQMMCMQSCGAVRTLTFL